ncbi:MAG: 3-dehydroquinate synthase [SAR324 cluster bacterium]|uniref:3-dehydroquinate synthase n=1 Tax=SAR324 cluster bacterium TaxID=2024889 RepID=A0A7X9FTJ8_9DELT|nr:3-dehydroquinate synthase [SAR324 cluster bacterium]
MRELTINGQSGQSRLLIGVPFAEIETQLDKAASVFIVDETVKALHPKCFEGKVVREIPGGEDSKSVDMLEELYGCFLQLELDRLAHIVAVGGGCVCDVTALAAATYMRGVQLSIVPTTLLAQVDAGVGGKNAVNFGGFKNIVGSFRQPSVVLCDPSFLKTLPRKELSNGFAEAIKHALILNREYFEFLATHAKEALAVDEATLERVVYESLVIKSSVVERDELENGERMKLNFGHTIGHAVEATTGLSHGEAVSIGMVAEAKFSLKRGLISDASYSALLSILGSYELPTRLYEGEAEEIKAALRKDKKRRGERISLCVLDGIGNSRLEEVETDEIEELVDALCLSR